MEIVAVTDIHSNLISGWEKTLEELLDVAKDSDALCVNLGDNVGEANLVFTSLVRDYVAVPGNHDVEAAVKEVIKMREKEKKKDGAPFPYWARFYEEKTWRKLEGWGYGASVPISHYLCYYILPMETVCFILSHISIRKDKEALSDILKEARGRGIKYIYNLYGHTHSKKLKISREKYVGIHLISVHLPPFYEYKCAWSISFDGEKVTIKEVYFDEKGNLVIEKADKVAKRGVLIE